MILLDILDKNANEILENISLYWNEIKISYIVRVYDFYPENNIKNEKIKFSFGGFYPCFSLLMFYHIWFWLSNDREIYE